MPSYFRSLEHLLRYCARPPFALERLSVRRGLDGRIAQVRYLLPRHKAANWVGPGRGRKSTRPGANGVVELSPFDRRRTRGVEAPGTADWDMVCADARKTPPQGVRGVLANRLRTAGPPSFAARGQSFSQKTVADVPLTRLSLSFPFAKNILFDYYRV